MGSTAAMMAVQVGASLLEQKRANAAKKDQYEHRLKQSKLDEQASKRKRGDALKRDVARYRASFAGRGLNPLQGSSSAVVEGLKSKSSIEEDELERALAHQRSGMADRYRRDLQPNLLEKKIPSVLSNIDALKEW